MKNSDSNPRNLAEEAADLEFLQNLQSIKEFAESFSAADFENSQRSDVASRMLKNMPKKLQEYLAELAEIEKRKKDKDVQRTPQEAERRRKEDEEKLAKIAKEVFIISCASNKPLEESLKFCDRHNLQKEINNFGENGLNPLFALTISGKGSEDLQKLLERGANLSVRNASGMTVLDLAVIVGNQQMAETLAAKGAKLNLVKGNDEFVREQQQNDRGGRSIEKEQDSKSKQSGNKESEGERKLREFSEKEQQRQEREQQQVEAAGIALELHQMSMISLRDEQRKSSAEIVRQVKAKQVAEQERLKQDLVEVEKSKSEVVELAKKDSLKSDLKVFEIALDGETDINKLLFSAVQNGQSNLAILLIKLGADVNSKQNGNSVLAAAANSGNTSLVSALAIFSNSETKQNVLRDFGGKAGVLEALSSVERSTVVSGGSEITKKNGDSLKESLLSLPLPPSPSPSPSPPLSPPVNLLQIEQNMSAAKH